MAKKNVQVQGSEELDTEVQVTTAKATKLTPEMAELKEKYKAEMLELRKQAKVGHLSAKIDEAIRQLERLKQDPGSVVGIQVMCRVEGFRIPKAISSIL